jgi:toluene monooxygenase system protein D
MANDTDSYADSGPSMAGPIIRGGDVAIAALEAIREDNPEKEIVVEDHGTYMRIEAAGGLVIRRKTMEGILGRPFDLQELQGNLSSFSGQIDTQDDLIRWYFKLKQ